VSELVNTLSLENGTVLSNFIGKLMSSRVVFKSSLSIQTESLVGSIGNSSVSSSLMEGVPCLFGADPLIVEGGADILPLGEEVMNTLLRFVELAFFVLGSSYDSFAGAASDILDGLHSKGGLVDVLGADLGKFSALFSEVDLSPGGSLEERPEEAPAGVVLPLGDQEVLDGSFVLPGLLPQLLLLLILEVVVLVDGLDVAGHVSLGVLPVLPDELPGLH